MKKVTLFLLICICHYFNAQITIQNTQTPSQLVQNVLLGNGINAFNIKFFEYSQIYHNVKRLCCNV